LLEVNEAGDGVFIFGPFFMGSNEVEWERGSHQM